MGRERLRARHVWARQGATVVLARGLLDSWRNRSPPLGPSCGVPAAVVAQRSVLGCGQILVTEDMLTNARKGCGQTIRMSAESPRNARVWVAPYAWFALPVLTIHKRNRNRPD